jgi:hypothetical protein
MAKRKTTKAKPKKPKVKKLTAARQCTEDVASRIHGSWTEYEIDMLIAAIAYDTSGLIDRLDLGPGAPRDAQDRCEREFQRRQR